MINEYRQFLKNGGGRLSPDLVLAMVCERTGWTYEQTLSQPVWFIKTLLLKWNLDGEHAEQLSKQHGAK